MNYDDQQIDKLLRSVQVPENLHQRLKELTTRCEPLEESSDIDSPIEPTAPSPSRELQAFPIQKVRHQTRIWWSALAAALLIGFVGWSYLLTRQDSKSENNSTADNSRELDQQQDNKGHELVDNAAKEETPTVGSTKQESLEAALASYDDQIAVVKQQLMAIQNRNIQHQIQQAERKWLAFESAAQFEIQKPSLILALSAESALRAGLASDKVKVELQRVIQRFPSSAGADRANSILEQMN